MFALFKARPAERIEPLADAPIGRSSDLAVLPTASQPARAESNIPITDLIALHHALQSASTAMNGAINASDAQDALHIALLREERDLFNERIQAISEEIVTSQPVSRADRQQKLRFSVLQAGPDEAAVDKAIKEFLDGEQDAKPRLPADDLKTLRAVADELFLAELALRMLSKTDTKYESLRLLIARSAQRIDAIGTGEDDDCSVERSPWGPFLKTP